jgi:glutathione S-transferase
MTLTLHMHPLASYCWKALIALYETGVPFENKLVDLGNPVEREAFYALCPLGKFPALQNHETGEVIPESTIIIEYLAQHHAERVRLIPEQPEQARKVRALDRFIDLYIHESMQKIVGDRIRPAGEQDAHGVHKARATLATSYDLLERELGDDAWAAGAAFSMADCAAAPALHYAHKVQPLGSGHPRILSYMQRLEQRPSFARVLTEARPYFHMFPG